MVFRSDSDEEEEAAADGKEKAEKQPKTDETGTPTSITLDGSKWKGEGAWFMVRGRGLEVCVVDVKIFTPNL